MSRAPHVPPALRALIDVSAGLVRRSASGRVGLARAHDVFPPGLLTERALAPLREAREETAVPLPFKEVERLLRDAWGTAPAQVLDHLDREPLAVRPAAQVHRGVLDGEPVAIKVQRPGLPAAVRSDLVLLDALATPMRAALPSWDPGPLLREARDSMLDELDLEAEASTMRRVRRALRGVDGLVLPASVGAQTTETVLVTTLLDGPTLADGARPDDAEAVARTLLRAHVAAAREGLALTDARPGHVVLLDDGTVGLLGTGVARPVPRERALATLAVLGALRDADEQAAADALAVLGAPAESSTFIRDALGPIVGGPATLDAAALQAAARRALTDIPGAMRLAAATTPHPADQAIARGLGQLAGTLAVLGVTLDWPREALAGQPSRRPPGPT